MVPGKTVLVEGFLGVGWASPTMPDERHGIQMLRPFSGPSHRQEPWSVPAAMGWGGFRSPLEPGIPLLDVQWCVGEVVQEEESGSSIQLPWGREDGVGAAKTPVIITGKRGQRSARGDSHCPNSLESVQTEVEGGNARALKDRGKGELGSWRTRVGGAQREEPLTGGRRAIACSIPS